MDLVKNIKNAVVLYKKNIKKPKTTIAEKEIAKFIFDLRKFSINIFALFFFILNALKSSHWPTNPFVLPIVRNLFFLWFKTSSPLIFKNLFKLLSMESLTLSKIKFLSL